MTPPGAPDDRKDDALPLGTLLGQIEELTGVGLCSWSRDYGAQAWSDRLAKLLGLDPRKTSVNLETFLDRVHPADLGRVLEGLRRLRHAGGRYELDHRVVTPDGQVRWVRGRGRAEKDSSGQVLAVGTVQDLSEVRRSSQELAAAWQLVERGLTTTFEQSIIGLSPDGVITAFNAAAQRMTDYTAEEMIGTTRLVELHDRRELRSRAAAAGVAPDYRVVLGRAVDGDTEDRRWTYVTRAGQRKQVLLAVTTMRDADANVTGYVLVGTDITTRMAAERTMSVREALFEEVFDHAGTAILLIETNGAASGRIFRVNPAACQITGYREDQLLGMKVSELVHPEQHETVPDAFDDLISGRTPIRSGERRWVRFDGDDVWVQVSTTKVDHHDDHFLVCMAEDVTARKQAEVRLSHLALHDVLTGLPNRSLLLDRIDHALAASARSKQKVALYYLDLDGFKEVNDEEGHLAGDEVLKMVAQRLSSHVRPGDTVARLGGDEFVVLCPDLPPDADPRSLAARLLPLLSEPFPWNGRTFHLSASIGVAGAGAASTAQELLRQADDAMYVAKDAGKNRVHQNGDQGDRRSTALAARHVQIEAELGRALDRSELVLHGQPVLALPSGQVVALEMLIRWKHPTRGLLPPAEFLDVAENSPLMDRVGRWVLSESCRIAATLPAQVNGAAPDIFVNISGRQLESGQLLTDVADALHRAHIPPQRLVLELTETTTPMITGSLLHDIEHLREQGVRFAIDDIGTGYSSLARLTELPVDILKIDRSFVARIGENNAVDAVVHAIVSIAQSLHLDVVAEGVETSEQEERLTALGCRTVQGFRYSPARPEPELLGLIRQPLRGAR